MSENVAPLMDALSRASAGMDSQSLRLRLTAENLSNTDTPGYRRKLAIFQERAGVVSADRVVLDSKEGRQLYDPSHPLADESGVVTLSNVDMMIELADAREAGRGYDANLRVFSQARQLYGNLLDILRR